MSDTDIDVKICTEKVQTEVQVLVKRANLPKTVRVPASWFKQKKDGGSGHAHWCLINRDGSLSRIHDYKRPLKLRLKWEVCINGKMVWAQPFVTISTYTSDRRYEAGMARCLGELSEEVIPYFYEEEIKALRLGLEGGWHCDTEYGFASEVEKHRDELKALLGLRRFGWISPM